MEKQILQAYIGDSGYTSVVDRIYENVQNFTPESIVEKEFKEELEFIFENSDLPMFEVTGFCTNNQKIADENVKLKDLITFIKSETTNGDYNFLLNLAKEEHIANKRFNNTSYDAKSDAVLTDLRVMLNEKSSVIKQAFDEGMFNSIESQILHKRQVEDFKNTTKAKAKNKIAGDTKDWDILNESHNYASIPLQAINPIGVKMDINDKPHMITKDVVISAGENGYEIQQFDEFSEEVLSDIRPLMNAFVSQYRPETNTFEMNGILDFDVIIDDQDTYIIDTVLEEELREKVLINADELQELLFESSEMFDETMKEEAVKQSDNMLLLMRNRERFMVLEDLIEITNPKNNNTVIIEALKDGFNNERVVDLRLQKQLDDVVTPTYRRMVSSIMEVLETDEFQSTNILQYFQDKINKEVELSEEAISKIDSLKVELDSLTNKINDCEALISLADSKSEIYKTKTKELADYNKTYSELLITYKDLRERNAYYS